MRLEDSAHCVVDRCDLDYISHYTHHYGIGQIENGRDTHQVRRDGDLRQRPRQRVPELQRPLQRGGRVPPPRLSPHDPQLPDRRGQLRRPLPQRHHRRGGRFRRLRELPGRRPRDHVQHDAQRRPALLQLLWQRHQHGVARPRPHGLRRHAACAQPPLQRHVADARRGFCDRLLRQRRHAATACTRKWPTTSCTTATTSRRCAGTSSAWSTWTRAPATWTCITTCSGPRPARCSGTCGSTPVASDVREHDNVFHGLFPRTCGELRPEDFPHGSPSASATTSPNRRPCRSGRNRSSAAASSVTRTEPPERRPDRGSPCAGDFAEGWRIGRAAFHGRRAAAEHRPVIAPAAASSPRDRPARAGGEAPRRRGGEDADAVDLLLQHRERGLAALREGPAGRRLPPDSAPSTATTAPGRGAWKCGWTAWTDPWPGRWR